ncbi:hypothetical protein BST83_10240 [Polaribacter filamentus]|uniref:Uncharacterized protein n=1 Tax=Polaribacter filamentus TaxID=53483 RepID=A0A2S7KXY3_9FLAO|nr:hypothetical protein [Polaribacter filamentus]PQB07497.1 hypothetical protein BST83_10240 [Polaribacter filamentus]
MKLSSEMKSLSEGILISFKQRVKESQDRVKNNAQFINEVHNTLDNIRQDRKKIATALRDNLKGGEKERLSTYNNLMSGIRVTIGSIQKDVSDIQSSTFNLLNEFGANRAQIAVELENLFAQGQKDRAENNKIRIKSFGGLMKTINADLKSINSEVLTILTNTNGLLAKFEKEHQEMSADLNTELSKNLSERVEYTRSLVNGFQKSLAEISKENKQLAKEMRETLANSQENIALNDVERIKNYNLVINAIQASIEDIRKGVNISMKGTLKMIADFSTDRSLAATEWSKMKEEIRQIQQGVVGSTRNKEKVKTKQVSNVVVDTIVTLIPENTVTPKPSKSNKKTSVSDKSEVKEVAPPAKKAEKTVAPLSLEEKILVYIKSNSQGVKVSEMEEPLKETRMRLGFVAKKLLELGQIRKIDNLYYPKK